MASNGKGRRPDRAQRGRGGLVLLRLRSVRHSSQTQVARTTRMFHTKIYVTTRHSRALSLSLSLSLSLTVIIAISAPPPPLRPESHLLNYSLRWTSFTLLPTAEVVLVDGGGGSTIKVEGATDTSSLGLGLRRLDKGRTDSSEERSGAVAAGYDGGVRSMAGRKEGRKTERGQRRQELAGRLTPTPPFRSRQIRFHFPWAPPSLPSHFQIFKF